VLVNAWDAGSARVIEHAGAKAIATSSAGMAWSLGYPDGERLPAAELVAACARICRAVRVPVSVDIERGFGRASEEVGALVRALIGLGAVGVNIEDGVAPPAVLCERIRALRTTAEQMQARLFINARIDTYLTGDPDRSARFDDTVRRARRYVSAGADGVFVPGLDPADVARLARAVPVPLNVYAGGGWAPPVVGLGRAGVRRVSLGCGPLQAGFALLRRITREAIGPGSTTAMSQDMLGVQEVNDLFASCTALSTQEGAC
jgi:2-methylisocitrate lyase-like PEP mutase family enzyme